MPIRQWLGRIALIGAACVGWLVQPAVHAADFLDPQDAFRFSATVTDGGKTIEAHFRIADGYYLYYERFGFAVRGGVDSAHRNIRRERSSSTRPLTRRS